MNYDEHTMHASGRTRDRATESPGWAGWRYRRPLAERVAGWLGLLGTFALLALLGAILGWGF